MKRLRASADVIYHYFMNGLLIIAPIALSLMIVAKLLAIFDDLLGTYIPLHFPGLGLISGFIIIILCGWLSSYFFLRNWIKYTEQLLSSIPIVKTIFKVIKQIQGALFDNKRFFHEAVLVPYPYEHTYALGFVVSPPSNELAAVLPEGYVCVFLPFSLNMTTGTNLFVHQDKLRHIDITTESALQFFLSAGTAMPVPNSQIKEQQP